MIDVCETLFEYAEFVLAGAMSIRNCTSLKFFKFVRFCALAPAAENLLTRIMLEELKLTCYNEESVHTDVFQLKRAAHDYKCSICGILNVQPSLKRRDARRFTAGGHLLSPRDWECTIDT